MSESEGAFPNIHGGEIRGVVRGFYEDFGGINSSAVLHREKMLPFFKDNSDDGDGLEAYLKSAAFTEQNDEENREKKYACITTLMDILFTDPERVSMTLDALRTFPPASFLLNAGRLFVRGSSFFVASTDSELLEVLVKIWFLTFVEKFLSNI